MVRAAVAFTLLALFVAPVASPVGPGDPCYGMVTCGQRARRSYAKNVAVPA